MSTITYAHSDETGAPVLNNAAGSLDALLHAMLVTGWRVQTLTSLTVSGGVATATLTGHGYSDQRVVEISGATPSGLNGRKLITVTGSSTFTFAAAGVSDGSATGTISVKRAGCGWTRTHNSGTTSIYARTDPTATSMSLHVQDDNSTVGYARVRQVWGVSDIATWAGQAPATGNHLWPKGQNDTSAKRWLFVGDGKTMYLLLDGTPSWPASSHGGIPTGIFAFGDFSGDAAGSAWDCFLAAMPGGNTVGQLVYSNPAGFSPNNPGGTLSPRSFTGLGNPVSLGMVSPVYALIGGGGHAFPSPVDNGMRLHSPVLLCEANDTFAHPIRGALRGLAMPLANCGPVVSQLNRSVIDVSGSTRKWLLAGVRAIGADYGMAAFDLTGPW